MHLGTKSEQKNAFTYFFLSTFFQLIISTYISSFNLPTIKPYYTRKLNLQLTFSRYMRIFDHILVNSGLYILSETIAYCLMTPLKSRNL